MRKKENENYDVVKKTNARETTERPVIDVDETTKNESNVTGCGCRAQSRQTEISASLCLRCDSAAAYGRLVGKRDILLYGRRLFQKDRFGSPRQLGCNHAYDGHCKSCEGIRKSASYRVFAGGGVLRFVDRLQACAHQTAAINCRI